MIKPYCAAWIRSAALLTAVYTGARISTDSVSAAEFKYPLAVAVAPTGNLYIVDRYLPGIWRVEAGKASELFVASTQLRTPLNAPRCAAIDLQGNLLVGDSGTRDVYRFDAEGKPVPLTKGAIGIPMAIGVLSTGELLVADLELHRIWKVGSGGGEPEIFAEIPSPRALFVDSQDRAWVVSHGDDHLLRLNQDGAVETIVHGRPFSFASAVVVDEKSIAYVCDTYAKAVWRVDSTGTATKWAEGKRLVSPVGLAWQGRDLLVADPRAKAVLRITPDAQISEVKLQFDP